MTIVPTADDHLSQPIDHVGGLAGDSGVTGSCLGRDAIAMVPVQRDSDLAVRIRLFADDPATRGMGVDDSYLRHRAAIFVQVRNDGRFRGRGPDLHDAEGRAPLGGVDPHLGSKHRIQPLAVSLLTLFIIDVHTFPPECTVPVLEPCGLTLVASPAGERYQLLTQYTTPFHERQHLAIRYGARSITCTSSNSVAPPCTAKG